MSLRKDILSWGLIVLALLLIAAAAFAVMQPYFQPRVSLHLGDGIFHAELARTDAERTKGLAGVTSLGETDAMLFVYNQDGRWEISTKNISVPIDIIWLNTDKKIVYIVKNVSPDSDQDVYIPQVNARYVVEVAAGTVDKKAITVDKVATFDLNQVEGVSG